MYCNSGIFFRRIEVKHGFGNLPVSFRSTQASIINTASASPSTSMVDQARQGLERPFLDVSISARRAPVNSGPLR